MQVRLYTLDEANAILPRLAELFSDVRQAMSELRDLRDQLVDLRIVWGDDVEKPSCDGNAEYERFRTAFTAKEAQMQRCLSAITELGCEVKDVEAGLIDFHARRGEDVVLLCWRAGEDGVKAWHPRNAGYAGRRPIEEF